MSAKKPKPSRAAEQLRKLLIDSGVDDPSPLTIHRTHAGRHQRSSGAWSWWASHLGERDEVCGSQWQLLVILSLGKDDVEVSGPDHVATGLVLDPTLDAVKSGRLAAVEASLDLRRGRR